MSVTNQLGEIKKCYKKSCHICFSDEKHPLWVAPWVPGAPRELLVSESNFQMVEHIKTFTSKTDTGTVTILVTEEFQFPTKTVFANNSKYILM